MYMQTPGSIQVGANRFIIYGLKQVQTENTEKNARSFLYFELRLSAFFLRSFITLFTYAFFYTEYPSLVTVDQLFAGQS